LTRGPRAAQFRGYGIEQTTLLRPFALGDYAATRVSPLVMDFIGKRMMVSQHKWMRSMWWLRSRQDGLSLYAGVHNTARA
jgi:hypothetical protein